VVTLARWRSLALRKCAAKFRRVLESIGTPAHQMPISLPTTILDAVTLRCLLPQHTKRRASYRREVSSLTSGVNILRRNGTGESSQALRAGSLTIGSNLTLQTVLFAGSAMEYEQKTQNCEG